MPPFGPIRRKDFIGYLRELGFESPRVGGQHQYMVKGMIKLRIPDPHEGDIQWGSPRQDSAAGRH
jgi:hypothetical protein